MKIYINIKTNCCKYFNTERLISYEAMFCSLIFFLLIPTWHGITAKFINNSENDIVTDPSNNSSRLRYSTVETQKLLLCKPWNPRTKTNSYNIDQTQNDSIYKFNLSNGEYVDTINQDDIVRKQYALLPYPAVAPGTMQMEREHYAGNNKHIAFSFYPSNTLEGFNHFLYKGRNQFRYGI